MIRNSILKSLYYQMLRIRMIEEAIAVEYQKQEMRCPVHLCIGEEAISSGVIANLKKSDIVMSNHRSHGHFIGKGGNLNGMIAEIYGKETGCSKGIGGSQHLIDLSVNFFGSTPIVGGTIPVATGVAWAAKLKKEKKITAVFFGDAAVEGGPFHESLNFAATYKLPILYICENNFYSIFTDLSVRQPKRDIYQLAKGQSVLAFKEDGNDILKVYETAKKAVKHIRAGKGPAFIEFTTYRLREHCGPNEENPGERPVNEVNRWKKRQPVPRLEKYLLDKKIYNIKDFDKIKKKITSEIEKAMEFARKSPYPDEMPSERQVYA